MSTVIRESKNIKKRIDQTKLCSCHFSKSNKKSAMSCASSAELPYRAPFFKNMNSILALMSAN